MSKKDEFKQPEWNRLVNLIYSDLARKNKLIDSKGLTTCTNSINSALAWYAKVSAAITANNSTRPLNKSEKKQIRKECNKYFERFKLKPEVFAQNICTCMSAYDDPNDEKYNDNPRHDCLRCSWGRSLIRNVLSKTMDYKEFNRVLVVVLQELINSEDSSGSKTLSIDAFVPRITAELEKIGMEVHNQDIDSLIKHLYKSMVISGECLFIRHNKGSVLKIITDKNSISDIAFAEKVLSSLSGNCDWKRRIKPHSEILNSKSAIRRELYKFKDFYLTLLRDMKINLTGPNTVGCFNKIIFNARKVNRSLFKKTITRNILQIEKHIEENICNFTYNCLKDEGWIKALVEQNENKFYHALCSVLYAFLDGEEPQYNMFLSMNCNHMRLFGEKKTDVIRELDWHKFNENRPIHRPNLLFGLKGRDQYLSIPYDANIGFMVYRKDIIEKFNAALKNKDIRMAYETAIFNEITAQGELFDDGYCFNGNTATLKSNISQLVTKSKGKFETWEEILAFFEIFPQIDAKGKLILKKNVAEYTHNNTGKSIGVLNGKPLHLLMETQTFDTFVSTMLEIIWNCGGSFEVSPDYKINNEQEAKPSRQMMRAMYLISKLFGLGIVPKNATLDADEFGKQYSKEYIKEPGGEWVFARHWYSTFIDVLTASNKVKVINKKGETTEKVRFSWDNEDARLDIMRMPVSYAHYVAENAKPDHISCWGDWHFCVLSGSENTRLGVDLINNLMSSEKVYQRAAANAALPSVEAFYKLYGDTNCFNVPQRADNLLPDMSYAEIRRQFFGTAQSRSQIFDFHHCMRELHSVLEYIRLESQKIITAKNFKGYNDYLYDGTESIYSRVQKTFANIEKFIELPLLME